MAKDMMDKSTETLVDDQVMLDALTRTLRFTPEFNDLISLNVVLDGVDAQFMVGHRFIKTNKAGFELMDSVITKFAEIRKEMIEAQKEAKKEAKKASRRKKDTEE